MSEFFCPSRLRLHSATSQYISLVRFRFLCSLFSGLMLSNIGLQVRGTRAVITDAQKRRSLKLSKPHLPNLKLILSVDGGSGSVGPLPGDGLGCSGTFGNRQGRKRRTLQHHHLHVRDHRADRRCSARSSGPPGAFAGCEDEPTISFLSRVTAFGRRLDWAWIGGLLDVLLPALHHGVPVVACRFSKFTGEAGFWPLFAIVEIRRRLPSSDCAETHAKCVLMPGNVGGQTY